MWWFPSYTKKKLLEKQGLGCPATPFQINHSQGANAYPRLVEYVVEILTYFICFFFFVHLWMIIKLHGGNDYIYIYNYGQYKLLIISN
jgi:hypothetical protein